ncbi:hypothetical protein [Streptomyces sp. NP-1717]|uniref:hypothetical protein n=1 Tax=Streptomyces sp. NP-1717 TaxID=2704470 RepID=UPI001F5C8267|nr:hypothetical protein [Streptomyces sp. NP-1717]
MGSLAGAQPGDPYAYGEAGRAPRRDAAGEGVRRRKVRSEPCVQLGQDERVLRRPGGGFRRRQRDGQQSGERLVRPGGAADDAGDPLTERRQPQRPYARVLVPQKPFEGARRAERRIQQPGRPTHVRPPQRVLECLVPRRHAGRY